MPDRLLKLGIVGTVITSLCCFTEVGTVRRLIGVSKWKRSMSGSGVQGELTIDWPALMKHKEPIIRDTPVAVHEGTIAVGNILKGNRKRPDCRGTSSVAFTVPSLARAGLLEEDARDAGYDVEVKSGGRLGPRVHAVAGTGAARWKHSQSER